MPPARAWRQYLRYRSCRAARRDASSFFLAPSCRSHPCGGPRRGVVVDDAAWNSHDVALVASAQARMETFTKPPSPDARCTLNSIRPGHVSYWRRHLGLDRLLHLVPGPRPRRSSFPLMLPSISHIFSPACVAGSRCPAHRLGRAPQAGSKDLRTQDDASSSRVSDLHSLHLISHTSLSLRLDRVHGRPKSLLRRYAVALTPLKVKRIFD